MKTYSRSLKGIAGAQPNIDMARLAVYAPKFIASFSDIPSNKPTANPAVYASPAPVVSTTCRPDSWGYAAIS